MKKTPIFCIAFTLFGCKATVIGTSCGSDGDCNVSGQHCVAGYDGKKICTHTCSDQVGENGCPIGYDCTLADSKLGQPTCNKVAYAADSTGAPLLFGKKCALDDGVCLNTGDPNPMPMCRKGEGIEEDPHAYCTGACTKNLDCPVDFQCGTDYDDVRKCLKNSFCSECFIDADCPPDFPACVPTSDGKSRYCTKTCIDGGDCGGAQGDFLLCENSKNVRGEAGKYCLHRRGTCVGKGEICDPCRTDADCAKTEGAFCLQNPATFESFCTLGCGGDADCEGPNGAVCDTVFFGLCLSTVSIPPSTFAPISCY
jgi:hypothetical protein